MDPFDAYKLYNALKLHFESDSYDAVKYNFKTSVKPQAYFQRRDKIFFARLAKRYPKEEQLIEYLVANFVNGTKWVGELTDDEGEKYLKEWIRTKEAISYEFQKDIDTLYAKCSVEQITFDDLLQVKNKQIPQVCILYKREEIKLTTLVILNRLTRFMHHANTRITETIVWPDLYRLVVKSDPFVKADLDKCKKIVVNTFNI